jgi:transcriptional regulator with XRE-family HTH domain
MELREYCFRHRLSVTDLAKKIGYTRPRVSSLMNSKTPPPKKFQLLIESVTNGEVKLQDWSPQEIVKDPNQLELF